MNASNEIYDEIVDKIATPKARIILLEILKKEGKPEKVIQACLKALKSFPDDNGIRKFLAETYFEQRSVELAKEELDKISMQINELTSVYKLQAELFKEENMVEEAINSLKLYLAHHSNDQDAARLLSELSAPLKEEVSILPTSTLAEIYFKQGQLEEAITIYTQVVKDFPDDEKYKNRLEELKTLTTTVEPEKSHEAILKEKTVTIIGILERWLTNIEKRHVIGLSSHA
ncbi:MAG: tetratricopeptide repeat protein [Deltaproteobacteria bacterium]|nr:tetratricopeptide repeat protein [Deltaproteobacteria bacterium]